MRIIDRKIAALKRRELHEGEEDYVEPEETAEAEEELEVYVPRALQGIELDLE